MPGPLGGRFGGPAITRWLPLFFLLLAFLPTGCAYYNTFYLARKHYNQALVEEQRNTTDRIAPAATASYNKAIEQCSKVLQRYRGSKWADDAMLLMGKSYYGQGSYGEARKWLTQMITAQPSSPLVPEAKVWIARAYLGEEDFEAAAEVLRETLATYPEFEARGEALFFIAETDLKQERWEEAIAGYRELMERYPKSPRIAEGLIKVGDAQFGLRRYDEAEKSYRMAAARARDPRQRMQGLLKVGLTLEEQDRFDEATRLYDQLASELVPHDKLNTILSGFDAVVPVQAQSNIPGQSQGSESQQIAQNTFVDENGVLVQRNPAFSGQNPVGGNPGNPNNLDPNADPNNPAPPPDPRKTGEGNSTARSAASLATAGNPLAADLPLVLLRHGNALMEMGEYERAIKTFEAVLAAYPRTSEAGEAQYRIGYVFEVDLEDYVAARSSYDAVRLHGQSVFVEQAARRSGGLARLAALAAADTVKAGSGDISLDQEAEKKFLEAELSWFQQEKADRAIEQYSLVEMNYPKSSYAPKAALARAWLLANALEDTAAGRTAFEGVIASYPGSEQAGIAHQILYGEVLATTVRPDSLTIAAFEDSIRMVEALADSQAAQVAREQEAERLQEASRSADQGMESGALIEASPAVASEALTEASPPVAAGALGEALPPAVAESAPAPTWTRAAPALSAADSLARYNSRESARLQAEKEAEAMALAARARDDSLAAAAKAPVDSTRVALPPDPSTSNRPSSRLAAENATGLPRPFTMKKPARGSPPRASRPPGERPPTPAVADTTRPQGGGKRGRYLEDTWH